MNKKTFFKQKTFQKSHGKQYLKKYRLYPSFLYRHLDKWLKLMSLEGWHIVHCGLFTFVFEKGEPCEKEYFTYGLSTHEGKYSISLRYPHLEKTYGIKKKKSKINSNEAKSHCIIEIDLDKIDINNDDGYKELINDRNHLYLRYFIRNCIALMIPILLVVLYTILF